MVMLRDSFCLLIKAKSWGVLERRLDDSNYDSLTHSTKQKEGIKNDLTTSIKVGEEIQIDLNDVSISDTKNIIENDNNRSNNRSIYGDEERFTSISKKPIYSSYKDAYINRESITYERTNNATPLVTSE